MADKINKKLPVYELTIDPNEGAFVDAIALVSEPAIESNFFSFSKNKEDYNFSIDEDKKEIIGAAMIPNMQIFRAANNDNPNGYYVTFSTETIREIAQTFFQKRLINSFNLQHDDNENADSFIFQSFIVDSKKGINSPKNLNLPDGSWVIGIKVLSDDTWNKVKSGELKGFSVQGIFETMENNFQKDNEIDLLKKQVKALDNILNNTKNK